MLHRRWYGSVIHIGRYVCFIITSMLSNSVLHNRWKGISHRTVVLCI